VSIDAIRTEWRRDTCTAQEWSRAADQSGNDVGECKGEFFKSDGFPFLAYGKPGKIMKQAWQWPLPAYEKIAADLASDLACPVPAAQLWVVSSPEDGYAEYRCLSLKEFPQRYTWANASVAFTQTTNEIMKQLIRGALAQASGMLVLDTWLGQSDRGDHPNNVQLSYDPTAPARTRFTYLDFGHTMNWNGGWSNDGWEKVTIAAQPTLLMRHLDKTVIKHTYERAMALLGSDVKGTAERLSSRYFSEKDAGELGERLVKRRELLGALIAPFM